MSISIIDVAERANVSRMTITRVMRNDRVRKETRERVLKAMQELGYVPSKAARAMRSSDALRSSLSTCFAMVFGVDTQKADEYFCELTRGIEKQASEFGLSAMQVHWQEDSATSWLRMQTVLGIDGLCGIIMVGQFSAKEIRTIKAVNSNIVLVDGPAPTGMKIADVESDNFDGSTQALKHLLESGVRRPIIITGPKSHYFAKAMTEAAENFRDKFDFMQVINTDYSPEAAKATINRLVKSNIMFDGVFANDMSCVGAMKALGKLGIRIPEDIKIIGFDDIPICEYLTPSLTSISINKQRIGKESVKCLVDIVRNKTEGKAIKIRIKAELRKRESTEVK